MNIIKYHGHTIFLFLQAILAVGTHYYAPKLLIYNLFYCACANELLVNTGNLGLVIKPGTERNEMERNETNEMERIVESACVL